MYKALFTISLSVIPLMGFSGATIFAADDSSAAMPDCTKASTMMQSSMAPSPGSMMPKDHPMSVDAAYLKSMQAMLDHQSSMAHMEMACGSNATAKENAKKALAEMQLLQDEVTRLLRSIGV